MYLLTWYQEVHTYMAVRTITVSNQNVVLTIRYISMLISFFFFFYGHHRCKISSAVSLRARKCEPDDTAKYIGIMLYTSTILLQFISTVISNHATAPRVKSFTRSGWKFAERIFFFSIPLNFFINFIETEIIARYYNADVTFFVFGRSESRYYVVSFSRKFCEKCVL